MSAIAVPRALAARSQRRRSSSTAFRFAPTVVLIVLAAVYLAPFVWMISTSLKTLPQSIASPPVWIPNPIVLKAFPDAFTKPLQTEADFKRMQGVQRIVGLLTALGGVTLLVYLLTRDAFGVHLIGTDPKIDLHRQQAVAVIKHRDRIWRHNPVRINRSNRALIQPLVI